MSEEAVYVDAFSDEELHDFADIFNTMINEICKFADKHNYDRDNIVAYAADKLAVTSQIATVKDYPVKEGGDTAKRGRWVFNGEMTETICSECYIKCDEDYDFCPNCGAKMDGE